MPIKKESLKKIFSWPILLAYGSFALGAAWRFRHIFYDHPASRYIYNDMLGFVQKARNWLNPAYVPNITDAMHPPGTSIYLALTYGFDPSWQLTLAVQWLLSCLVPLILAATAYELYGQRVMYLTLMMSSLYFPFIKYAG